MPTHRSTSDWPPQMLLALERAHALGEITIPCSNPRALRLEFDKLRGQFRREGISESIDQLSFHVLPDAMVIRVKASTPLMQELAAALGSPDDTGSALLDKLTGS